MSARKRYSIIFLRGHFVCYPHCQGDFNTSQLCWQLRMACFVRNAISFMPFVTALVLKVTTCMNGIQQFWVHQSPSTKEEYFSWIFIFQQIILLNHPRYEWKYYLNIWSGFFKIHRVSVFSLFPREEIVILKYWHLVLFSTPSIFGWRNECCAIKLHSRACFIRRFVHFL